MRQMGATGVIQHDLDFDFGGASGFRQADAGVKIPQQQIFYNDQQQKPYTDLDRLREQQARLQQIQM